MKKRRLVWLFLWGLSLLLISFRGGTISYSFFFFFTGLPLLSFLYLLVCLTEFRVYQTLQTRVVTAGTPVAYTFVIENAGLCTIRHILVQMYPDFSKVEAIQGQKAFSLLPGESFRFDTTMLCKYRGSYLVGLKSLLITDFLGLFRLRYRIREPFEAIVNTRIPSTEEFSVSEDFSVWQRRENRSRKDCFDSVVRTYESGDSFRSIHWKASAATGVLKVFTKTGEQQENISVFLNTRRIYQKESLYLPSENRVMETVLFFVSLYLPFGQPVLVTWPKEAKSFETDSAFNSFLIPQLSDFDSFYDRLQTIDFEEDAKKGSDSPMIRFLTDKSDSTANEKMILISQSVSEEEASVLSRSFASGTDLLLCLIGKKEPLSSVLSGLPVQYFSAEEVTKV